MKPESESFYLGLLALVRAIELRLAQGGAILAMQSVRHARVPRGSMIPPTLRIVVVPANGPRLEVDFSTSEIEECESGDIPDETRRRIEMYVEEFNRFRNSPDRSLRVYRRKDSRIGEELDNS